MNKTPPKFSLIQFSRQFHTDLIALIIVLLLSFYVVYFSSHNISRLFFLLILCLFFFFKKDYFWFAYLFIIVQGPGHFFADFSGTSLHRLPLYTFLPGFSFTPLDLFVILVLVKAFMKGKKIKLSLQRPLALLAMYMILIIIVTSLIFTTTIENFFWNLRWLFYYSILISFLYLVYKKNEIYRFILLISPVVLFIFFTQVYFMTTGNEFIDLFNPGFRGVSLHSLTGELRPLVGGTLLVFFSFIFSLFLLEDRHYKVSKVFLYLIIGVSFLSVFISATRIWFVIFSFILVGYVLVSKKKMLSVLGILSIFFLIISTLVYSGLVPLNLMLTHPWMRLQQVFDVARGNIYSVDTAMNRLIYQLPRLIDIIKQNPFIGHGFSNVTMSYYDNDFGFLNTILMFGVIGFSLFIFLFVKIFAVLMSCAKRIGTINTFDVPLKILLISWIGILIGYFSTWDFFTMDFGKVFFISLLIAIGEFFIRQASKEELLSKKVSWVFKILYNKKNEKYTSI